MSSSYGELKQLLEAILTAPHAVYVPTKLSLTSKPYINVPPSPPSLLPTLGLALSRRPSMDGLARVGPKRFHTRGRALPLDDQTTQEVFFISLESQVNQVSAFVSSVTFQLRSQVEELSGRVREVVAAARGVPRSSLTGEEGEAVTGVLARLMEGARSLGDEYLQLER